MFCIEKEREEGSVNLIIEGSMLCIGRVTQ